MAKADQKKVQLDDRSDRAAANAVTPSSDYRREIIQTIDEYRGRLKNQRMDRRKIHNRLRLLQMRDQVGNGSAVSEIEKELRSMSVDIEEPTLRMQRSISIVIGCYTFFAIISFILLTATDRIMLPGFNIPYSVLLMGLIGSLVSMFVKLPNIRVQEPLSYDTTLWFIINPLVAVIMAGIFFGVAQIFMPLLPFTLLDESWPFWILAWSVGLINWVSFYEKINGSKSLRSPQDKSSGDGKVQLVNKGKD
jgi:hypothetical protein